MAHANDIKTAPRIMMAAGPWISKFRQTNGSYTAQVTSKASAGFDFAAGLKVGSFFFADLTAAAFFPAYSAGPKARDANYFSPYGAQVGLSVPFLPLEFYGGIEKSYYGLSGGVDPGFHGYAVKAGARVNFVNNGQARNGIALSYRRVTLREDDAGEIPAHITTYSHVYFVGIYLAVN